MYTDDKSSVTKIPMKKLYSEETIPLDQLSRHYKKLNNN